MQKLTVVAKIDSYFWYNVVALKLCKEYLNVVTCNTTVLL